MADLRLLPAVDQVLRQPEVARLIETYGRPLVLEAVRTVIDQLREQALQDRPIPPLDNLEDRLRAELESDFEPTLRPVINATGVILHTNLGRAPLSDAALQAIAHTAGRYSTLEYELEKGQRGSRAVHAERLLTRLTGAEAALVVNNNAAAVLLVLSALARRKRVIISRTQLVEVGGGFRIPDVMAQSGARLVEIGTTNRVHLADYENALENGPALILRAHPSNYRLIGFTGEPSLAEVASLAHRYSTLMIEDLGSGTLIDTERYGLAHEPTVTESLQAGADVVTFSGDKLLGGPQAGIILGRKDLLAKIRKHPLARAVRADKLQLAALAATLESYRRDRANQDIPIWRMVAAPLDELERRARYWQQQLGQGDVVPAWSTIGGGSLPGEMLESRNLALRVRRPDRFLAALRSLPIPLIARIEDDQVRLDPRTVLPQEDQALLDGLTRLLSGW